MRRRNVVASLLLVALTAGLTLSNTLVAQNQDTVGSDRLKSLKQEYMNTLQSRVDAVESRYKVGISPLPHLVNARIDLLDAELEFATTRDERVEILKQKVENLREKESLVKEGQKSGLPDSSPEDALLATAERLRAEISSVREQGREE